jgi:hypothetical protein
VRDKYACLPCCSMDVNIDPLQIHQHPRLLRRQPDQHNKSLCPLHDHISLQCHGASFPFYLQPECCSGSDVVCRFMRMFPWHPPRALPILTSARLNSPSVSKT